MKKKIGSLATTPLRSAGLSASGALLGLVLLGGTAHAVVLGEVRVQSHLGQPLVAEIDLIHADPQSLKAELAAPSVYRQHNVDVPHGLGRVGVKLVERSGGLHVLRVTSERPVSEPALQLMLEAQDQTGSIVRNMTVLLDPAPVGAGLGGAAVQPAQAAAAPVGEPARATRLADAKAARGKATPTAPVARKKKHPAAKQHANPAPASDTAVVAQAPPARAAAAPAVAGAPSAAPALASAPSGDVRQEESLPATPVRGVLVAARTDADRPSTMAAVAPPVGAGSAADTAAPAPATEAGASTLDAGTSDASAADASVAPAVAAPASDAVVAEKPAMAVAPSLAEDAGHGASTRHLWAGTALALAGGLLGVGLWRRRRRGTGADTAEEAGHASLPMIYGTDDHGHRSVLGAAAGGDAHGGRRRPMADSSLFRSSAFHMLEEVDPIAEADVYIAYGRVNDAEAILQDALGHQPERAALHLKMLSIHYDRRDVRAFNDRALHLAELTDRQGPEWEEASTMGQRLEPDNPLFAPSSQPAPGSKPSDFPSAPATRPDGARAEHGAERPVMAHAVAAADEVVKERPRGGEWDISTRGGELDPVVEPAMALAPARHGNVAADSSIEFRLSTLPDQTEPVPLSSRVFSSADLSRALDDLATQRDELAGDSQSIDLPLSDLASERVQDDPASVAEPDPAWPTSRGAPLPGRPAADEPVRPAWSRDELQTSRFDTLPAKLAQVQQLTEHGDRDRAAAAAREVARLLAQLRGEAALIASAAGRGV